MKLNIYQKICLGFFVFLLLFWMMIALIGTKEGSYNYLYGFLFGLIPLVAGIIAMGKFRIWSGFQSAVGKGVFFVGLGIFCWGMGAMFWAYYNFFVGVSVPYPSLADIFYAPSIFFYGLGAFYLSGATGAKFGFKNTYAKIFVVVAPIVVLFLSYYLLVVIARGGVFVSEGEPLLKTVLDIVYPLGDFVGLLLAVIISGLSFKYLGGKYKSDIFAILLGIGVMFVSDATFSYTTTVGTYYNGSFVDLMLTVGTFLLSFGVLGFCKLKGD